MRIALVAALTGDDYAIGYKNRLPWKRLAGELALFKRITMGHAVIMGRSTYESLPNKPLPGRYNIIVSRQRTFQEAHCSTSLEQALKAASEWDRTQDQPHGTLMVIGGGEVYRQTIGKADILYLTYVAGSAEKADTYFPRFRTDAWYEDKEIHVQPATKGRRGYRCVKLLRKP